MLWSLAILSLLLVPILTLILPPLHVSSLPGWSCLLAAQPGELPEPSAAHRVSISPDQAHAGLNPGDMGGKDLAPRTVDGTWRRPMAMSFRWPACIVLGWAAGALAALLPVLAGSLIVRVRASRAARVTDAGWLTLLATLRGQMQIRRSVALLQGGSDIPSTLGVLRPAILLPAAAGEWSPQRRRAVLLHELAHVKRVDCLTQMVAGLIRAAYWYHPLVWLASAETADRAGSGRVMTGSLPAGWHRRITHPTYWTSFVRYTRRPVSPWWLSPWRGRHSSKGESSRSSMRLAAASRCGAVKWCSR